MNMNDDYIDFELDIDSFDSNKPQKESSNKESKSHDDDDDIVFYDGMSDEELDLLLQASVKDIKGNEPEPAPEPEPTPEVTMQPPSQPDLEPINTTLDMNKTVNETIEDTKTLGSQNSELQNEQNDLNNINNSMNNHIDKEIDKKNDTSSDAFELFDLSLGDELDAHLNSTALNITPMPNTQQQTPPSSPEPSLSSTDSDSNDVLAGYSNQTKQDHQITDNEKTPQSHQNRLNDIQSKDEVEQANNQTNSTNQIEQTNQSVVTARNIHVTIPASVPSQQNNQPEAVRQVQQVSTKPLDSQSENSQSEQSHTPDNLESSQQDQNDSSTDTTNNSGTIGTNANLQDTTEPSEIPISSTNTETESTVPALSQLMVSDELQKVAKQIETDLEQLKEHTQKMTAEFHHMGDVSARLLTQLRILQRDSNEDFSGTYEQMTELRNNFIATRQKAIAMTGLLDLVEEALESDMYVAQTRKKV